LALYQRYTPLPVLIHVLRHEGGLVRAEFSPDSRRILTVRDDNKARVGDAAGGEPLTGPLQHQQAVNYAAFSPDGRYVITASDDCTARVWGVAKGQAVTAATVAEADAKAAAMLLDRGHAVLQQIARGEPPADQRRNRNANARVFPICSQTRGPKATRVYAWSA
jgi:hypothetical protein